MEMLWSTAEPQFLLDSSGRFKQVVNLMADSFYKIR